MELWVDKYSPKKPNEILGNESSVKKIVTWLGNFKTTQKVKMLLLIGKPGVGKTTTINVIADALGYTLKEYNASDSRSAKMVKEILIDNTSLDGYFFGMKPNTHKNISENKNTHKMSSKQLILMDEVDGMEAAGMTELINMSKQSKHPIICICNVETTSVRKLNSSHAEKIRFYPVPLHQIVKRMKLILKQEKITVADKHVVEIVESCDGDVRKTLNELQYHTFNTNVVTVRSSTNPEEDFQVPNDTIFGTVNSLITNRRSLNINQALEYYYSDHFMVPLFIQENYPCAIKDDWSEKTLENLSEISESISIGDQVGKKIFESQHYSLMPHHGLCTTVAPVFKYETTPKRVAFPASLGKASTAEKNRKISTKLSASISKIPNASSSINSETVHQIAGIFCDLLQTKGKDGIPQVLAYLKAYNLDIEDYKNIMSMTGMDSKKIDSKVKSALTRAYKTVTKSTNKNTRGRKNKKQKKQ